MKKVRDYPKKGQFVVVWEYGQKIWSGAFKWKKGVLYEYVGPKDKFCEQTDPSEYVWGHEDFKNRKFFVIE